MREKLCLAKGIDRDKIVRDIQPICFENAVLGLHRRALRSPSRRAAARQLRLPKAIGDRAAGVLHSGFCCRGPQGRSRTRQSRRNAAQRGNRMLLRSSQATSPLPRRRAQSVSRTTANKVRNKALARYPERSRARMQLTSFPESTASPMCRHEFDYYTGELKIVRENPILQRRERAEVRCYGADDVREGVAIMQHGGR